jgi:RES domain-containing protein
VAWENISWRIAGWDTPLWSGPNRRPGRYNRAGSDPTQYLCLHPWGPWAEMLRWDDRRTPDEARDLSTRIWSVRVSLSEAPRRISFDDAAALSVEPEDLVSEDYTVCQELADEARSQGETALIVPSAALPGTETLVLFGPKLLAPWQQAALDIAVDVPAAVTADRSGPPLAVLPHVRWRGTAHEGLRRWRIGLDESFREPVPTPT